MYCGVLVRSQSCFEPGFELGGIPVFMTEITATLPVTDACHRGSHGRRRAEPSCRAGPRGPLASASRPGAALLLCRGVMPPRTPAATGPDPAAGPGRRATPPACRRGQVIKREQGRWLDLPQAERTRPPVGPGRHHRLMRRASTLTASTPAVTGTSRRSCRSSAAMSARTLASRGPDLAPRPSAGPDTATSTSGRPCTPGTRAATSVATNRPRSVAIPMNTSPGSPRSRRQSWKRAMPSIPPAAGRWPTVALAVPHVHVVLGLNPVHPSKDHLSPSPDRPCTNLSPETPSSSLMDQCSRHDIPPAVQGTSPASRNTI